MADGDHELAEGTYVVVSGTGQVMDLPGAGSRYTGQQAWVYTRNNSSAQIVRLIRVDAGWVLYWPLTGMVLSAAELDGEGRPFQGSKVIFQHNTGQSQAHWEIEFLTSDSGYDWYRIKSSLDPSLSAIHEGRGSESKIFMGDPIAGTGNMIWRFEPVDEMVDGTYRIMLASSTDCDLMANGSKVSIGAVGQSRSVNGDVWLVSGDGYGRVTMTNIGTGTNITSPSSAGALTMRGITTEPALFTPVRYGSVTYNNEEYDAWYFRAMVGQNLVIDPYGTRQDSPMSYALATEKETVGSMRYAFFLLPTEAHAQMSMPNAGMQLVGGVESAHSIASGTVTAYPTWASDGETFQARYRYRVRRSTQANDARSKWSEYRSIADGSTYAEGWGAAGSPNVDATLGNGRWASTRGVTFTLSANDVDLVEIDWQIRRFEAEWPWRETTIPAHSDAHTASCSLMMAPYITIDSLSISTDGAVVGYHADWARPGSTVRIWSDGCFDTGVMGDVKVSKTVGGSSATAPDLRSIPSDGQTMVVQWTMTTCDGATVSGSSTVAASCDITGADPMHATITEADGLMARVWLEYTTSQRLWVVVSGEAHEIKPETDSSFLVPYPMLRDWEIRAVAIDSNSRVRSFTVNRGPMGRDVAVWNWDGGGWLEIEYAADAVPTHVTKIGKDSSAGYVSGREWRFVQVSEHRKDELNVSGSVVCGAGDDAPERAERLGDCRFAWFRDPAGGLARVAVTSVSRTHRAYGIDVAVKMERVDG